MREFITAEAGSVLYDGDKAGRMIYWVIWDVGYIDKGAALP